LTADFWLNILQKVNTKLKTLELTSVGYVHFISLRYIIQDGHVCVHSYSEVCAIIIVKGSRSPALNSAPNIIFYNYINIYVHSMNIPIPCLSARNSDVYLCIAISI
jgi:hypothetical protein